MTLQTVWWERELPQYPAAVGLIDQTQLPLHLVKLRLTHEQEVAEAITSLKVRGAPAIGVTAAFGVAVSLARRLRENGDALDLATTRQQLNETIEMLAATRPTAVNLFWALERMRSQLKTGETPAQLFEELRREAQAIADEDQAACLHMGQIGAELIPDGASVLTHCNAGALATAGIGTALAPIYVAHQSGKRIHVFVDETRPVLQGARLTAWELQQQGVPLTLITDNMAGYFMRQGRVQAVFVGSDRIAANGDVANKIGTYSLAVLAKAHQIPFYVVAPTSTIDLSIPSGEHIPIEQRPADEVSTLRGVQIAPSGIQVANPAFDVTPHDYVTAIITENGLVQSSYGAELRRVKQASLEKTNL
jgi:methylthioribose-1-phosphate isomerase